MVVVVAAAVNGGLEGVPNQSKVVVLEGNEEESELER